MASSISGRKLGIVLAALAVAAVAFGVVYAFSRTRQPGRASGDPLDVKLVAVWPEESADLLDASGKKIGETLGTTFWPGHVFEGHFSRSFVFDISAAGKDGEFIGALEASTPGGRSLVSGGSWQVFDTRAGRRLYAGLHIPRKYRKAFPSNFRLLAWWWRDVEVTSADIALLYYGPARAEAEYTFTGPFTPGKTYQADSGAPGTLEVREYYGPNSEWGTWVHLKTATTPRGVTQVIAYDKAGGRHRPGGGGGVFTSTGVDTTYTFEGVTPQELSALTYGEKMRRKTFHNVKIAYADRPERTYPEYLDEVAKRLNIQAGDKGTTAAHHQFERQEDALKVIDVVKGRNIITASFVIPSNRAQDWKPLSAEDRERAARAAETWLEADDPAIRAAGIRLGIKVDFRRFAAAAFEAMAGGDSRMGGASAEEMIGNYPELNAEDVRRIGTILSSCRDLRIAGNLVDSLMACHVSEAATELAAVARDEKSPYWWRVMRSKRVTDALGPVGAWPLYLKARYIIASEFAAPELAGDAEANAEALRLLPTLITARFEEADSEAFASALRSAAQRLSREGLTKEIAEFLRSVKDCERAGPSISLAVRCLNLWGNVNIAGVGADISQKTDRYGWNWRQVAAEALAWLETGKVVPGVPEGYRARPGDLRIVLQKKDEPETAAAGLWVAAESTKTAGRVHRIVSSDSQLFYSITPMAPILRSLGSIPAEYGISLRMQYGNGSTWTNGSDDLAMSALPQAFKAGWAKNAWVISVEAADSPESAIKGTKAFDAWWKEYGPEDKPAGAAK